MTRTIETIEIDMNELEDALRRAAERLDPKDYAILRAVADAYDTIAELVDDKNTTIARLRKMLFGARTEKTAAVVGSKQDLQAPPHQDTSAGPTQSAAGDVKATAGTVPARENVAAASGKGHGRNGAAAYAAAEKVAISHESLTPGDACPQCEQGTIYETGRPGVLVRLVGQAAIQARIYQLQKLRCNLCGVVFTAQSPAGVGAEKYDATVGSMIAVLKYGSGMPFHRLDTLQANLGIPLPASTQWEIVYAQAEKIEPAYEELIRQAAQGEVLCNDDTTVKILELMNERAKEVIRAEGAAAQCDLLTAAPLPAEDADAAKQPQRKGLFTSGIVSTGPASGCPGRQIALFFSGRKHAGENLADVLAARAEELTAPIQMCDALTRNLPGELKTILAHCLAHGRRRFVEVAERFPEECRHVLESLAVVYRNDAIAKEQNFSPEERLRFHQAESGPVMEELRIWLVCQFDEHRVEPNSALGSAISYLLKHWERLTLFLRVAGAPLDNNVCERALKRAILHRKNAYFYKTPRGAHVGDLYMSLIHTCQLCGVNPFDYLTELERQAEALSACPACWMPWNYRQTSTHQS
jgi:transposase